MTGAFRRSVVVVGLLAAAGCGSPVPPAVTPPTVPAAAPRPRKFTPPADPQVQGWVAVVTLRHVNQGIWNAPPSGQTVEEIDSARRNLVRAGPRAAPHLVAVACDLDFSDAAAEECVGVLSDIGPAAVEAVRAGWEWTNEFTNDLVRWRLMPFRARHDPDAALRYALAQFTNGKADRAIAYFAEHKPPAGQDELLRMLGTADVGVRWCCVDALAGIGGPEVVAAFVKPLDKDSWARNDHGPAPSSCIAPVWYPDGRDYVVQTLRKMRAAAAVPALVRVLEERGPGRAYLGGDIIPMLGEYGGPECVPALTAIAATGAADLCYGSNPSAVASTKALAAEALQRARARTK